MVCIATTSCQRESESSLSRMFYIHVSLMPMVHQIAELLVFPSAQASATINYRRPA